MTRVIIEFRGLPPFKASPGPGPTRAGAKKRQQEFKAVAQRVLDNWINEHDNRGSFVLPWNPMSAKIELDITYTRVKGDNDAANIIGGICDALQGIFYANDKQVETIKYSENPTVTAREDLLIVEISTTPQQPERDRPKEPVAGAEKVSRAPLDWDQQLDRAWSARADVAGVSIPGPQAALDAAKILDVTKLSSSPYKTLQGLLDASELLKSKWTRKVNTIIKNTPEWPSC